MYISTQQALSNLPLKCAITEFNSWATVGLDMIYWLTQGLHKVEDGKTQH